MQEHTEQHLDKLAEKVIKSSSLKSPSIDFTANIMEQIEHVSIGNTITYKPLISKKGWFGIIAILIGISLYVTFGNIEGTGWFDAIDYSVLSNIKVPDVFSGITFSKTLVYAIGFFGLLFFIQIPLMKYNINKNLEY